MKDIVRFTVNDIDFEVIQAPCFEHNGIKAWSKFAWTTGKDESALFDTQAEAQQDAIKYASREELEAAEQLEQQYEENHQREISSPFLTGRI